MFDMLISYLLWLVQLPILPLYYHLPEWFWLGMSLDKISGVFETYGIYLIMLGFTSCAVYYRNTVLKPVIIKLNQNLNNVKLRATTETALRSFSSTLVALKTKMIRFFK